MKRAWKLDLTPFDSSGEGDLTCVTPEGTITLPYSLWAERLHLPTETEWKSQYQGTWAESLRDELIQVLVAHFATDSRPNHQITGSTIEFFDAEKRKQIEITAQAHAVIAQAPVYEKFLTLFHELNRVESGVALVVIEVHEAGADRAFANVRDVLQGTAGWAGQPLSVGYDSRVPLKKGRLYLTLDSQLALGQYIGKPHAWRCRLRAEVTEEQIAHAKQSMKK